MSEYLYHLQLPLTLRHFMETIWQDKIHDALNVFVSAARYLFNAACVKVASCVRTPGAKSITCITVVDGFVNAPPV